MSSNWQMSLCTFMSLSLWSFFIASILQLHPDLLWRVKAFLVLKQMLHQTNAKREINCRDEKLYFKMKNIAVNEVLMHVWS